MKALRLSTPQDPSLTVKMDLYNFDSSKFTFKSKAEAEKSGQGLGLEGSHSHLNEAGETVYMPGKNHKEFMESQEKKSDGRKVKSKYQAARDAMYQKRLKDMGSVRKYSEKKVDHPASAHKKKKSPYADGIQSDAGTIGRLFDEVL